KDETAGFQLLLVSDIDFVTMAVALRYPRTAIDPCNSGTFDELRLISSEPHRATEVARRLPFLEQIAAQPFGHQADHRLSRRAEFRRRCLLDSRQGTGGLY